jgi:hypothetical protein
VVEAEIKISVIVEEAMDGSKVTMVVVVLIKVIPTIILVPIHQVPNLGIQTRVLVLPTRFATSLDTPRLTVINA